MSQRLREIFFFFSRNIMALLVVTLPFAVAASFIVHAWGEPIIINGTKPVVMHAQSAVLLVLLYPLALGVKIVAIHRLARGEGIALGPLLADALRAWPIMAGISLLMGFAVGGGLFLFIIPGIWCYARLGYAPILAVTEGLGILPALVASWQRTQERQFELFTLTMLIGSALVTIMLLVLRLVATDGTTVSLPADMMARGLDELLFCLLTIAFYRYWSLGAHTP